MRILGKLLTAFVMLTAAPLFAQNQSCLLMKVDVPFAFSAGKQILPAGNYYVTAITPENTIALVSSPDGQHSLILADLPNYSDSPSADSRLVFQKYGNEYFLTQVWVKGDNVARNPLISKRQSDIARSGVRPSLTTVLADAH